VLLRYIKLKIYITNIDIFLQTWQPYLCIHAMGPHADTGALAYRPGARTDTRGTGGMETRVTLRGLQGAGTCSYAGSRQARQDRHCDMGAHFAASHSLRGREENLTRGAV